MTAVHTTARGFDQIVRDLIANAREARDMYRSTLTANRADDDYGAAIWLAAAEEAVGNIDGLSAMLREAIDALAEEK